MPSLLKERIHCATCGKIVSLRLEPQTFHDGSQHLRGSCPSCNRWIKWVPWDEPRLYVGKYANLSISTIAQRDPQYLQWALKTLRLSHATRTAIQEALHAVS